MSKLREDMKLRKRTIVSVTLIVCCFVMVFLFAYFISERDMETYGGMKYITSEEMLEDYDLLWRFLRSEIPFVPLAMEARGVNIDNLISGQRDEIEKGISPGSYALMVAKLESQLQNIGHLRWLRRGELSDSDYAMRNMKDYSKSINASNSVSRDVYQKYMPDDDTIYYRDNETIIPPDEAHVITINTWAGKLSDDVAYIYFSGNFFPAYNYDKLHAFYESISDCKNLIIDVRNNKGGDNSVWGDAIVKPLTNKKLVYESYSAYSLGEYTLLSAGEPIGSKVSSEDMDKLKALPNFNEALSYLGSLDVQIMKGMTEFENNNQSTAFSGKIWVLTNKGIYDAADCFVNFCKATGFAATVGKATDGNGVSADPTEYKPAAFQLPNSGITFKYNAWMGFNCDGSSNAVCGDEPDYAFEGDALKHCLELIQTGAGK